MIFLAEAILKIITLGLIKNGPNSYLKSNWNRLDIFIVIVSLIEFSLQQSQGLKMVRTLRLGRLLRPIRLFAHSESLKAAINSLAKSVTRISELLCMVILVIFIFAVLQTYLFSGKFFSCYTYHLANMNEVRQA